MLRRALAFVSDTVPSLDRYGQSIVPDDGINHFLDCDFWIVLSDRASLPIAPLRPRGHVIYDYIQQIRPDVFPRDFDDGGFVFNVQEAQFVLCTTPFTAEGAVTYGGVPRDRVHLVDMEIEVDLDELANGGQAPRTKRPYILWPTNTSPHKNQLAALDALDLYLGKYAGKLDVICSGLNTHWYAMDGEPVPEHRDDAIKPVRDRVARSRLLRKRVKFVGELSEADYFTTLAQSSFLFHPALVDNGTYAVTEAAWFGVPSLSHDYPAIRWMDERFGLALAYCDARDPEDVARALVRMEEEAPLRRSLLPSRERLQRHSWKSHARAFWSKVGRLMEATA
jgi:glycosyltransferase involved in cell wall biosynthesis